MFSEVIHMAEFCLKCFQRYFNENAEKNELIISKDLDLCEGCADYKHVVIGYRRIPSIKKLFGLFKKKK